MKGYSIQSDDKEEEKQTGERLYVYENQKEKMIFILNF